MSSFQQTILCIVIAKTSNIQVEKAVVNGAHIELIDTPGFENTKRLDLRRMASEVGLNLMQFDLRFKRWEVDTAEMRDRVVPYL